MSEGVTFLSEPLEQETEITGPIAAKLWVSSATEDADLFLVVRAFTPDLKEVTFQGALDAHTPIAQGWLRCSHRKLDPKLTLPYRPYHTHDEEQKLTPGQVYEVDVEVWPTCIVLPKGYRIALSVRGTDYVYPGEPGAGVETLGKVWTGVGPFTHDDPRDRPPAIFGGDVTLHAGPAGSPMCCCRSSRKNNAPPYHPSGVKRMSYREVSEVRDGMQIDWDMPITMDDGLVLRCDVFRPLKKGRYPVLLSYGPYGKWLHFEDGYKTAWDRMALKHPDVMAGSTNKYQSWEVCDPEKWVPDGYACVRVDSRGCGRSPGYVEHWSPRETKDFHDCIEWAGTQPWSNGKVGLSGISYYAINQWQVASLQPKHLAAICVWEGFADFYRELSHNGGIYNTFAQNWYDMQVKTVQYGLGTKGHRSRMNGDWVSGPETLNAEQMGANRYDLGKTYFAHPLDDEFYEAMRPDWSKVKVPMLSAANWGGQPLHPRGNFEGFYRSARSRNGSRCTASSIGRTTTPTMELACRRNSSAIS